MEQAALTAVQTTAESRSRWQETHIRAEAERIVRSANLVPADAETAVDRIVAAALGHEISVPLGAPERFATPAPLQRADGTSVYSRAGTQLYTSTVILEAEERIITAAGLRDGRTVSTREVDMALLEQAANGFELNTGQAQLVRDLATSGSRVQLALALAGTGKTSAMAVFARAIEAEGSNVIGLAPTAAAAKVLGKDLDAVADTMHKLAHTVEEIAAVQRGERGFVDVLEWVEAIDERTFVIIDEAGMAATTDLDAVISYVTAKGGSVRPIGDDQQLASVASGAVLRDIHATHGSSTLTDVVRFSYANGEPNHTEGRASLALRAGNPAAIGFYIDNARITVGDTASAEDLDYEAWAKDIAATGQPPPWQHDRTHQHLTERQGSTMNRSHTHPHTLIRSATGMAAVSLALICGAAVTAPLAQADSVIDTITLGGSPSAVAITPTGDRAYTANTAAGSVSVIEISPPTTQAPTIGTVTLLNAGNSENVA